MTEKIKILATNRKAFHEYHIGDKFEAGIALLGSEVKSCRLGRIQLKDSYVRIQGNDAFLLNCNINPYEYARAGTLDPERPRRLLLHKRELKKLYGHCTLKGYTIIPLRVYLRNGRVKLEIALARGKKIYDKRERDKARSVEREVRQSLRESRD
ncbi:SsrA-binding protein SmpB [Acidobacteriota bacterium]